MANNTNGKPVVEIRVGRIIATIWQNTPTDEGVFYSVHFARLFRRGSTWDRTPAFGRDDLIRTGFLVGSIVWEIEATKPILTRGSRATGSWRQRLAGTTGIRPSGNWMERVAKRPGGWRRAVRRGAGRNNADYRSDRGTAGGSKSLSARGMAT